eukprot:5606796-Lingulodinium_polyedra.AAC.1
MLQRVKDVVQILHMSRMSQICTCCGVTPIPRLFTDFAHIADRAEARRINVWRSWKYVRQHRGDRGEQTKGEHTFLERR